jgi:HemY protein
VIRLYLILLVAFALGVLAIILFAHDTGYVLLHYNSFIVETSVPGLLLAVAVLATLVVLALRLVSMTMRLPQTIRETLQRRRSDHAQRSFELGLLRLFEGGWNYAEIDLVRRVSDHHAPHLNYLAAAIAAQKAGAPERRDEYLRLAAQGGEHVQIAAQLTRAELMLIGGDHAGAKAAAQKLRQLRPLNGEAVTILAESLAALGEWDALATLLASTENLGAPAAAQRAALSVKARRGLIANAVVEARLDKLKAAWEASGAVKANPVLRNDYIRALARLNADAEAAAQINAVLAREWDADLALLHADLHAGDAIAQLASVEQWLSFHGEKPQLLLIAGIACRNAHLWGKAQSYLDAAARVAPSPRVYQELALLAEQTHQSELAARHYREGLDCAVQQSATP